MVFDGDEHILIPELEFSPGHREFLLRVNCLRCQWIFLGLMEDKMLPNTWHVSENSLHFL